MTKSRQERYNDFFNTLIENAKKNGLEFVDDCGHVSVRDKGDKNGKYIRIDDVIYGNKLMAEKLFY